MAYFASAAEVDTFVGGVLRVAGVHPVVGPRLRAATLTLAIHCQDPAVRMTVSMVEPLTVVCGEVRDVADVELNLTGDVLDQFWRGDYDLLAGLASGEVVARGRVSRVLKLLPSLALMFPTYRRLVATKDGRRTCLLLEPS
jgi:hypothetical protein